MRDYRSISVEEFVAESIGMKMRWLARGLRRCDKQNEIEEWVGSMTSLWVLLKKMRSDGTANPTQNEKSNDEMIDMDLSTNSTKRTASQMSATKDSEETTEEPLNQKRNWGDRTTEETIATSKRPQGLVEVDVEDNDNTETLRILDLLEELPGIELNTEDANDLVVAGRAVCNKERNLQDEQHRARKKILIEIWKLALKRKLQRGVKSWEWDNDKWLKRWTGWVRLNDSKFKEQMELALPGWDLHDRSKLIGNGNELIVILRNEMKRSRNTHIDGNKRG